MESATGESALAALSVDARSVLLLVDGAGFSYEELAGHRSRNRLTTTGSQPARNKGRRCRATLNPKVKGSIPARPIA
jgi:DNA-directed RNA polymerase specialized sigma24 family protein